MGQGLHSQADVEVFWNRNHSDFKEPLEKQRHELSLLELDDVIGKSVRERAFGHSDPVVVGLKRESLYSLKKLKDIEKVDELDIGYSGVSVALGYWIYLRQSGVSRKNFSMREYGQYAVRDTVDYKCSLVELASAIMPDVDKELERIDPIYAAEVGSIDAGYVTYSDEVDAKSFWKAMFILDKEPEIRGTRFFINILSANQHNDWTIADTETVLKQVRHMFIYVDRKAHFLQRIRNMWEIMKADQLEVPCRFFFEGEFRYDRLILGLALCVGRLNAETASIKTAVEEKDEETKEMLDDILRTYSSYEEFDDLLNDKLIQGCKDTLAGGCGNYIFTDLGRPGALAVVKKWGYTALWDEELDIITEFGDFFGQFLYCFFVDIVFPRVFCQGNAIAVESLNWRSDEVKKKWDDVRERIKIENKFPKILEGVRVQYIKKNAKLDPDEAAKAAFDAMNEMLQQEEAIELCKDTAASMVCISQILQTESSTFEKKTDCSNSNEAKDDEKRNIDLMDNKEKPVIKPKSPIRTRFVDL